MSMGSLTRRRFLGSAAAALGTLSTDVSSLYGATPVGAASPVFPASGGGPPIWADIQSAYDLDRTAVYLNAAGVAPAPRAVLEAAQTDAAFRNRLPAHHLWRVLEPRSESIRHVVAGALGCDPEGVALTRGATEAMEVVQLGLDLRPGDHVVTTEHDFFRMMNTWQQRVDRDGISVSVLPMATPAPDDSDLLDAVERALTPRTRLLAFCHVTNLDGRTLPVEALCSLARDRGVLSLVDGAQAFGHVPVEWTSLGCDFYAGSLHKYPCAPLGTGFCAMRREHVERVWPLTPSSPARRGDIRKFEDVGTHPASAHNAVAEALRIRDALTQDAITGRIRALSDRWTGAVAQEEGIHVLGRQDHGTGIRAVSVEGWEPADLSEALWEQFRVVVRPVDRAGCRGVRASPHVYNTEAEIDRFTEALLHLRRQP